MINEKKRDKDEILKRIDEQLTGMALILSDGKDLRAAFNSEVGLNRADLSAAVRAARLSAACKRFKTACIIEFIFDIWRSEVKEGNCIEMSPYFAKDLSMGWFGRSGSHALLVKAFGKKGRVCRNHDHDQLDEIAEKHQKKADYLSTKIKYEIDLTKRWYKASLT